MYTTTPGNYLRTRGLMIKPEEPKNKECKTDDTLILNEKQHEIELEDAKAMADIEERKWKSCCFQLEPESSLFFGKMTVSVLVMGLCGYQLITLRDCNYQSLYSSILSSVITFWLSKNK